METCLVATINFAFSEDKVSMETKNARYLTVILQQCDF